MKPTEITDHLQNGWRLDVWFCVYNLAMRRRNGQLSPPSFHRNHSDAEVEKRANSDHEVEEILVLTKDGKSGVWLRLTKKQAKIRIGKTREEKEREEEIRQRALARLSDEEKRVLGLDKRR